MATYATNQHERSRGKRIGHLSTIPEMLREIKRVYREGRNEEITTNDMKAFGSILRMMVDIMETSDLEARIKAIENEGK